MMHDTGWEELLDGSVRRIKDGNRRLYELTAFFYGCHRVRWSVWRVSGKTRQLLAEGWCSWEGAGQAAAGLVLDQALTGHERMALAKPRRRKGGTK